MKFTIFDVETTGLFTQKHDRIIEISLITIDEHGSIIDEYDTLVNPKRDLGKSSLHGITSEMVLDAPEFADISSTIISMLHGSAIVAHNATFDTSFLLYELNKAGHSLAKLPGICTIELTRKLCPELSIRKLGVICEYFDIPLPQAHRAYYDAKATTDLFILLLNLYNQVNGTGKFKDEYFLKHCLEFTSLPESIFRKEYKREKGFENIMNQRHRLTDMINRLPDSHMQINEIPVQEYLNFLDDILCDRTITSAESEQLYDLASTFSLNKETVRDLHKEYLMKLIRVYLLDGVISSAEYLDLKEISGLLLLSEQLDLFIEIEKAKIPSIERSTAGIESPEYIGKSVCFTGELTCALNGIPISRSLAQELSLERGLVIKNGVTKDLDFLIVADPHTQSGKAKKARDYGVKIMAETAYWRMINVNI